ncbi:hypothetical protein PAXINDRAFT_13484 [Paxillus involutus ATCC 200175]|uniref:Uncharacterized protein n=1 Tax=Paxillus involutus ATCC 200175 TaxID=664439 RepID=A0A0C9U360_PAXIN|nr:hypothetical protein PAXINDRAFT_13484 [Paxillus involutus ATCC 200175]
MASCYAPRRQLGVANSGPEITFVNGLGLASCKCKTRGRTLLPDPRVERNVGYNQNNLTNAHHPFYRQYMASQSSSLDSSNNKIAPKVTEIFRPSYCETSVKPGTSGSATRSEIRGSFLGLQMFSDSQSLTLVLEEVRSV